MYYDNYSTQSTHVIQNVKVYLIMIHHFNLSFIKMKKQYETRVKYWLHPSLRVQKLQVIMQSNL